MKSIDGYLVRTKNEIMPARKKISSRADISGNQYGRLTALSDVGIDKYGYRYWKCDCSCGGKIVVRSHELKRGHTKSCGCLRAEIQRSQGGHNRLAFGEASSNELFASYKKSASSRGHRFSLSKSHFMSIVDKPCTYCGQEKNIERKPNKGVNGGFMYTGIDRVDSSKGYEPGNVVPCCWVCNRAKGTLTHEEFMSWVMQISKHNAKIFEHGEKP